MKILYLDFLNPDGHIRLNICYIDCLSYLSTVFFPCPKGRYNKSTLKAEILEKDSFKIKEGRIVNRLISMAIMFYSAVLARKIKPDYIFGSSYDTITFAIGRLFYSKRDKLYLLHHNNIDELKNKIKCWFFRSYMNKVEHIVFEDFIRDYLIDTFNLDEKKIHVLPHPLYENFSQENRVKKYSCVGLSNSNDETVITEIIDIENKYGILKKAKKKVTLKSRCIEYDNGYLKVIKGYLTDDVYNEYINNSECIYMPFPTTFRYRMSGTLVDSLSNNTVVFGSDIPLIRFYANKYPSACRIIYGANDFFEHILKLKTDGAVEDFKQFKKSHSSKMVVESFQSIFREDKDNW